MSKMRRLSQVIIEETLIRKQERDLEQQLLILRAQSARLASEKRQILNSLPYPRRNDQLVHHR